MTAILVVNKNSKYIIVLAPALALVLMCVAGPVNTYFRYILPIAMSLPTVAFLLHKELKR
jgi:hypothetical protein